MAKSKATTSTPLPASAYIIISVVGFLVSFFCVYYYLQNIQGRVSEGTSQRVFYLVLIVFGIAVSALVFGAMNSYGKLSGQQMDTKFLLTGPVVGVLLVVLGGFYLPKASGRQALAVKVVNEKNVPVTGGKITIYFPRHTREEGISGKGMAVFSDVNEDELTGQVKIDVVSDGYARLTFDTALTATAPLQLRLSTNWAVRITGQVTDADDRPIKGVEVLVDGTRFFARTVNNGHYTLRLSDFTIGDEVSLVTSHQDYKDKTKAVRIDREEMPAVDFVLQPLPPPR